MTISKKSYSDKLRDPRWQKVRLLTMQRDEFKCSLCGDDKTTLNVHHKKYTGKNPWDAPLEDLITICEDCHKITHDAPDYKFLKIQRKKNIDGIINILGYRFDDVVFIEKISGIYRPYIIMPYRILQIMLDCGKEVRGE